MSVDLHWSVKILKDMVCHSSTAEQKTQHAGQLWIAQAELHAQTHELGRLECTFFYGRSQCYWSLFHYSGKTGKMEDEENLKKNRIPKDPQRKDLKIPPWPFLPPEAPCRARCSAGTTGRTGGSGATGVAGKDAVLSDVDSGDSGFLFVADVLQLLSGWFWSVDGWGCDGLWSFWEPQKGGGSVIGNITTISVLPISWERAESPSCWRHTRVPK